MAIECPTTSFHIYMLILINKMDRKEVVGHSIANLVAACMIAYYFMNKEGLINV